ncbi:hypothetical protein JW968_07525 [Candidatus Woesearchaeota archaeon]|nr:hypothetical protein [Candidatus Woesearchaeota archaeon]
MAKKTLSAVIAAALATAILPAGISSAEPNGKDALMDHEESRAAKRYAVIYCPGSLKDKGVYPDQFDEGLKNAYLIAIANIYSDLRNIGFASEDIEVLYHDGTYDASETRDKDLIDLLAREKFGSAPVPASRRNLERCIFRFEGRISANDEFVFVIMNHGDREGKTLVRYYINGYGGDLADRIFPSYIRGLLSGIKAEHQFYVVDSCYSGGFAEELAGKDRIVFSSSSKDSMSVGSRIDFFARSLFDAMSSDDTDLDSNGNISLAEAFSVALDRRKHEVAEQERHGHLGGYRAEGFYPKSFNLEKKGYNVRNVCRR